MGESYQIYPILTCKLEMDRGHFTYRRNYGEKLLEFAQELLFQSSSHPPKVILTATALSVNFIMSQCAYLTKNECMFIIIF